MEESRVRALFAELINHHEGRLQQLQGTVESKIVELTNYTSLANEKAEWLNGQLVGVQNRVEETQNTVARAKGELEVKVEELKAALKSGLQRTSSASLSSGASIQS